MEVKFYRCKHCGQIVATIKGTGVPLVCCGEEMEEIKVGTVEASVEKHIPVVTREESKLMVNIGSVAHPMTEAHLIEWVALVTSKGIQIKFLKADEEPKVGFRVCECAQIEGVYAYCNLHGLWKAEL